MIVKHYLRYHFFTSKTQIYSNYYIKFKYFLAEVVRLELTALWSRTIRATNCATPRKRFQKTQNSSYKQIIKLNFST